MITRMLGRCASCANAGTAPRPQEAAASANRPRTVRNEVMLASPVDCFDGTFRARSEIGSQSEADRGPGLGTLRRGGPHAVPRTGIRDECCRDQLRVEDA